MSDKNLWRGIIPPGNAKIWRYMDFAKFISMLDKEALFFSGADKLGDPFEGSFPKANINKRRGVWTTQISGNAPPSLSEYYRLFVQRTAINCWHLNDYESDAMWKLYLKSGEGIAIQSSIGRLIASLKKYAQSKIYVYRVEYVDYETFKIPEDSLSPYFYKRISFKHENELRAVIQIDREGQINADKIPFINGVYVPVDLEKLIERVYVSPTCPDWQKEATQSIIDQYELDRRVRRSKLSEQPKY